MDIVKSVDLVPDPARRIEYHEIVIHSCEFDALVLHDFAARIRAIGEEVEHGFFLLLVQVQGLFVFHGLLMLLIQVYELDNQPSLF